MRDFISFFVYKSNFLFFPTSKSLARFLRLYILSINYVDVLDKFYYFYNARWGKR